MALTSDIILDRIQLKKQLYQWRFIAFIFILIAVFMLLARQDPEVVPVKRSYIARVHFDSMFYEDAVRERTLEQIAKNDQIKALILHINSSGSTVVGGESTYQALRLIGKQKPVVAVMGEIATSGGYMIALGADHIIARHGTLTGSIGLIMQTGEVTELAKKVGVTLHTFKSSVLKGEPSPFTKLTPEVEKAMMSAVDDIYIFFRDLVKDRRQLTDEEVTFVADGRVFSGKQALHYKLIDAIGGEREALEWLKHTHHIDGMTVKDVDFSNGTSALKHFLTPTEWWSPIGSFLGFSKDRSVGVMALPSTF